VKTVLCQVGAVSGTFRLRELKWIAGEAKTKTIHREHGCLLTVDLSKAYFSPRLSYERMRIANQVQPGEVIVNMFAGVGCFSIIIAKHSHASKIFSIDINPHAVKLMKENIHLNHLTSQVVPIEGDARETIETSLRGIADRVLMPLPEKSLEYLDAAITALKPSGGYVHYYSHVHARKGENPVAKVVEEATKKLVELGVSFQINYSDIVRTVGPNWYQVVLDIQITHSKQTGERESTPKPD
jgi:tRNA (guanine37-N1)-methyltransferase